MVCYYKIMAVTIHIPTPLRPLVGNHDEVEFSAEGSIQEVLEGFANENGDLKKHLFDEKGKIRNFVNIYVNEEDIRYQQGSATLVKSGDVISIVPSIAGGFPCQETHMSVTLAVAPSIAAMPKNRLDKSARGGH